MPSVDLGAVRVGEFRCHPDDAMWSRVNWIGPEPHVVFPRVPVRIRQAGADEFVTTRNHVVLYAAGDEYRRRRIADDGDSCSFLALSAELADQLGPPTSTRGLADASPGMFLRHRRFMALLRTGRSEPLELEEQAIGLATTALAPRLTQEASSPSTSPHLRALAERAKELLSVEYAGAHRLGDLAAMLNVSPYHLARSFRAATGWSLHGYRTSLRLRAVMDVLVDPSADLAALARDTGFANHSHLTTAFHRQFGLTPSAARAELAA
ncbi:MAG: AraC family transcriptional regulator [Actinomycetota bacterium]|jgi:AraC-like DNA-binding protein|nr:AraC family transcriptional regulator [Actinomycetota bacterium]